MRLWHKDLISCLPRLQLISQWKECCCIVSNIAKKGTPEHLLVNRVLMYPVTHFVCYTKYVQDEIISRGYKLSVPAISRYNDNIRIWVAHYNKDFVEVLTNPNISIKQIYADWHNDVYLRECLYNLEEKYLCGGIAQDDWLLIYNKFKNFTPLVLL